MVKKEVIIECLICGYTKVSDQEQAAKGMDYCTNCHDLTNHMINRELTKEYQKENESIYQR